jgi:hypothetical protein
MRDHWRMLWSAPETVKTTDLDGWHTLWLGAQAPLKLRVPHRSVFERWEKSLSDFVSAALTKQQAVQAHGTPPGSFSTFGIGAIQRPHPCQHRKEWGTPNFNV